MEPKFAFVLHLGARSARVQVDADGMNADDIETLIERLAELRAAMQPPVPPLNLAGQVQIRHDIAQPDIALVQGERPPGVDMFVLHPGLGWIALRFPSAQPLTTALTKLVPPGSVGPTVQ